MLDRQIAIVFEFRNFKEYFELTLRTLEGAPGTTPLSTKRWPADERQ